MEEKYSQGGLFPKGTPENPYSKNPRAQGAKRKRDYLKAKKDREEALDVSQKAREREWARRKERGEVFGDMPADFLQSARSALGIAFKAAQFIPAAAKAGRALLSIGEF